MWFSACSRIRIEKETISRFDELLLKVLSGFEENKGVRELLLIQIAVT